jgi:hypothetical protein
MELSKLQIIALCVLTTIITDKFLIYHAPEPTLKKTTTAIVTQMPTPVLSKAEGATTSSLQNSNTTNNQTEIILRELVNLRKDMAATFKESTKLASDSSSPIPTLTESLLSGMVKINSPQWKRLDVYEKPLTSSRIINSVVYDTIYFYRQKQNDWYQLDLDGGQLGWVQAQFLKDFP